MPHAVAGRGTSRTAGAAVVHRGDRRRRGVLRRRHVRPRNGRLRPIPDDSLSAPAGEGPCALPSVDEFELIVRLLSDDLHDRYAIVKSYGDLECTAEITAPPAPGEIPVFDLADATCG